MNSSIYMLIEEYDEKTNYNPVVLDGEVVSGPEEFILVRSKIATVHVGIKRNSEGLFIGRKRRNPILDSRIFADYQVP